MDAELTALLKETCTVYAWSRDGAYNEPVHSTSGTVHPCRVERRNRLVVDRTGRQVVSQTTIYLGQSSTGGWPGLTTRTKLTLSDGETPDILSVVRLTDETGATDYEAAYCG